MMERLIWSELTESNTQDAKTLARVKHEIGYDGLIKHDTFRCSVIGRTYLKSAGGGITMKEMDS